MPGDAGFDGGGFGCRVDSQCTGGTNGRCMPTGMVIMCTYDECTTDGQCSANQLCACGTDDGSDGRTANLCIPSNCRVDSDCGSGGYCSPSWGTSCGALGGVVGYYCHTAGDLCATDECTNDGDCKGTDAGGGIGAGDGYCAWDPMSSKWTCEYSVCSG